MAATAVARFKDYRPVMQREFADSFVGDPEILEVILEAIVRNQDALSMAITVMDEARLYAEAAE